MKNYNESMISLGEKNFIIDLDKYTTLLSNDDGKETKTENVYSVDGDSTKLVTTTVMTREYEKTQVIDGPKYDVLRMCLEVVLTYGEEIDDALGLERALKSTTIPFKIAFNTLLGFGILTEIE